jgi:ATP-binding cassette, subfamily F, member 3
VKVFEGSYQDFLDRDGWKDERTEETFSRQTSGKRENGLNRKDLKRIKAELINSRSRTLAPLQSRISEVEEEITQLEQGIEKDTQVLIEVSMKGDGESIKQLSRSIHESRGKIELLFDELQSLTDQFETKSTEFEERLKELQAAVGEK